MDALTELAGHLFTVLLPWPDNLAVLAACAILALAAVRTRLARAQPRRARTR